MEILVICQFNLIVLFIFIHNIHLNLISKQSDSLLIVVIRYRHLFSVGRYSDSHSTLLLERPVHLRSQFACVFERTSFWRRCRGTKRLTLFNTTIKENYFDLEYYFYLTNVCWSLLCICFIGVCHGRVVTTYYHSIQRLNAHFGR